MIPENSSSPKVFRIYFHRSGRQNFRAVFPSSLLSSFFGGSNGHALVEIRDGTIVLRPILKEKIPEVLK